MKKEYCRYAVTDLKTGVRLVCGEKYKVNIGLGYVESFKGLCTRFKKVNAYIRNAIIKGREVQITYWFNTPKHTPCRVVTDSGLVLGLR